MKPIYDALLKYSDESKARFHMPGHSGVAFGAFNEATLDVTEIEGLDNLLQANGVILEAEKLLAKSYKAEHSLMVTTGSTTCMQISIKAVDSLGYKIVVFGKMHVSFYNMTRLFNISYLECRTMKELTQEIEKSGNMLAIFTTSPDYFGNLKDLDKVVELAHSNKDILVVDSAHGAHFAFSKLLPKSISEYADISFVSMHKTMSCLGGAAVINVNDEKLYNTLTQVRSMCHSTSPSYLVMASMDYARDEYEKGDKYYQVKQLIDSLNGKLGGYTIERSDDFSRLVLSKDNVNCYKVSEELHKLGYDVEMAYLDRLVLIVTPYNYLKLHEFGAVLSKIPTEELSEITCGYTCKKVKNVEGLKPNYVKLENAIGKVANGEMGIYPPSIPIIRYRDIIDETAVKILKDNSGHLFGLVNGLVPVLE